MSAMKPRKRHVSPEQFDELQRIAIQGLPEAEEAQQVVAVLGLKPGEYTEAVRHGLEVIVDYERKSKP